MFGVARLVNYALTSGTRLRLIRGENAFNTDYGFLRISYYPLEVTFFAK